jgi:prolipoprotein diacylglyceryltransferase
VSDAIVLGRYLVTAGVLRFGIEFLRVNERVAFGLSVAHFVSVAAIALGAIVLMIAHPTRRTVPSGSQLS